MGFNSGIAWTDATFNPWIGCAKVSPGCVNCYAEVLMDTRYGRVEWGPNGTRVRTSEANWRKPKTWNQQAAKDGRKFFVFCSSLADVFEDRDELIPWRRDLFGLIEQTPNLVWMLLTKRPEHVIEMTEAATGRYADAWFADNRHVWLGTSVEDQKRADERLPILWDMPAQKRFVSFEPLLEGVELGRHIASFGWAIVGGESGHGARLMPLAAAQNIIDICKQHQTPVFFKQTGAVLAKDLGLKHKKGEDFDEWPAALQIQQRPAAT